MGSASSGNRVMKFADRVRCLVAALFVCSAVVTSSFGSDAKVVRPVPVAANRVTIDDAFWSPKLKTWRTVTIKDCLDKFEKDAPSGISTTSPAVNSMPRTAAHSGTTG